jgi:hypothetical protein
MAWLVAPVLSLATPAPAQQFDMEKVFWCDAGKTGEQSKDECVAARTAILDNCTSCHAITPIVKAQKEPAQWDAMLQVHRSRVPDVPDSDYQEIAKFLKAHYNPKNPVPKLPPELDKLGVPPA